MKRANAIGVALTALLLAGCQGDPGTGSTERPDGIRSTTSSTTPSSASTTTGVPRELSVDTARALRAADETDVQTIVGASTSTADTRFVLAISSTGQALVSVNPPPTGGALIGQARLELVTNGKARRLPTTARGDRPRQAFEGAVPAASSAVWTETRSTDLFDVDWSVFGWSNGTVRTLATSDAFVKGHPLPPAAGGEHLLAATDTEVWWAYTTPGTNRRRTDIATVDTAGKQPPRTVVRGGELPTAHAQLGLVYVRDPQSTLDGSSYEIHALKDGRDRTLGEGKLSQGEFVSAMCAGAEVLAWAVAAEQDDLGGKLVVMDWRNATTRTVQLHDSARSTSLGCGDDFVAWGNGSGGGDPSQYLLAAGADSLVKLGESPGVSIVRAAGRYVAWTLPPKSARESAPTRVVRWN